MNDFAFFLLKAGPPPAEGATANPIVTFLPFIAIIAIFYFLIIRPQSRKQKETQRMLSALKKGDKIVTVGGIHGTIQTVKENSVIVKVDDSTKLEFSRSAVSSITSSSGKDKEETDFEAKSDDGK